MDVGVSFGKVHIPLLAGKEFNQQGLIPVIG